MPRLVPPSPPPPLSPDAVREWIGARLPANDFRGKRVLLIVPDATRTAPLPLLFAAVHATLAPCAETIDVLVALGTHPPLDHARICGLLGFTPEEKLQRYPRVGLYNHEWDNPGRLQCLGTLSAAQTREISAGLLAEEVPVCINSRINDYDLLLVLGPLSSTQRDMPAASSEPGATLPCGLYGQAALSPIYQSESRTHRPVLTFLGPATAAGAGCLRTLPRYRSKALS